MYAVLSSRYKDPAAQADALGPPELTFEARSFRSAAWLSLTAVALSLLVFQAATLRDQSLAELHSTWRYWDDMALAATRYLRWTEPVGPQHREVSLEEATPAFQRLVERLTHRRRIEPWEFWRAVPDRVLARWEQRAVPAPLEDVGRSELLAVAYVLVGGVAPYLLLWLGLLLALPLLLWAALELRAAGWPLAGPVLIGACAVSPFVGETLTLPHSPVAFYLLGLFALVALVAWATSPATCTRLGFGTRLAAAALVFALGTIARAGTLLLLPGFVLALHWAGQRHLGRSRPESVRAGLGRTLLLSVVFILPYAALRPAGHHAVWLGLWEGLGDFGADRGYSWYDTDAKRALTGAGLEPFADPKDVTPEHERFFRERFLEDVSQHPLWYGGVLLRRTVATVGLTHLRPWRPRDGDALGTPRFHYKYTTPVDWLGFAGRAIELPVEVLWLPPLGVLGLVALARRHSAWSELGHRSRSALQMVVAAALACLPLPVLVSTASGIETQTIAIAYFLALGLVLDLAWASASRLASSSAAPATASQAPAKPRKA